jgi:hypothetical protein
MAYGRSLGDDANSHPAGGRRRLRIIVALLQLKLSPFRTCQVAKDVTETQAIDLFLDFGKAVALHGEESSADNRGHFNRTLPRNVHPARLGLMFR